MFYMSKQCRGFCQMAVANMWLFSPDPSFPKNRCFQEHALTNIKGCRELSKYDFGFPSSLMVMGSSCSKRHCWRVSRGIWKRLLWSTTIRARHSWAALFSFSSRWSGMPTVVARRRGLALQLRATASWNREGAMHTAMLATVICISVHPMLKRQSSLVLMLCASSNIYFYFILFV